jgi:hypothetical protein
MTPVIPGRREARAEGAMSRVKVNITMSLDGFVAGPSQSEKGPARDRRRAASPVAAPVYLGDPDSEPGPTGEGRS